MPNDNLGVAHGKIRITYDDRGSAKANAAMAKMAAQMETMQRSMSRLEQHLGVTDQKLSKAGSSFDKTSQATKKYSRGLDETSRSAQKFHQDAQKIIDDLEEIQDALRKAQGGLGGYSAGQGAAGVATGRSTRNINRQNQALQAAAIQFTGVQRSISKMTESMNDTNKVLREHGRDLRRAADGANGFSMDLFGIRKRIRSFINDVQDTHGDLVLLGKLFGAVRNKALGFASVIKILNEAGSAGSLNNSLSSRMKIYRQLTIASARFASGSAKEFQTWSKALEVAMDRVIEYGRNWLRLPLKNEWKKALLGTRSAVTLLGGSMNILRAKVLGIDRAIMETSPSWLRNMSKMVGITGALSSAFVFMGRTMAPFRILEGLAKTKIFDKIGAGTDIMSRKIQQFGVWSEKYLGRNLFAGFANQLGKTSGRLSGLLDSNRLSAERFSQSLGRLGTFMSSLTKDMKGLLGGLALIYAGGASLNKRLAWFFKLPKPIMAAFLVLFSTALPAAIQTTNKALTLISNAVAGLWGGIKQLGGGLTVIPGLIASIGAVVTSLLPVFAGLKDKMKDVFSDDLTKAMEAYYTLPKAVRPAAMALLSFKDTFKKMQENLQGEAFKGLEDQIKKIGTQYFPIVEKGARQVIVSLRGMKDEFVGFLLQGQTRQNTASIYASTADSIRQIAKATQPALAGLQAMAVVGSRFIANMSAFAPVLANTFNKWAQNNAANGNMMKWMNDSVAGAYDLVQGLKSATKAAYTLLTLFSTKSGADGLQDFAKSMDTLNKRVKESTITGKLAEIRNYFRQSIDGGKIQDLKDLMHTLSQAVDRILPAIHSLSDAFSSHFVVALQLSATVISHFAQLLNALGILDMVGWITGWVFAFKLLPKTIGAIVDGLKILTGAIIVLATRGKVFALLEAGLMRVALAMTNFGAIGNRVGTGLANVTTASSRVGNALLNLSNIFGIAAIAGTAFYAIYSNGKENSEKFNAQLKTNAKSLTDFKDSLRKAFTSDRGFVGTNVMQTVSSGIDTMMQNVEAASKNMPGFWDHVYDVFFRTDVKAKDKGGLDKGFIDPLYNLFNESSTINREQEVSTNYINAAKGLEKLRDAGVDLSAVLTATDSEFEKFIDTQRRSGEEGNAAADEIIKQRDAYKALLKSAQDAGPGQILLAEGIKKIAEAAGDATSKLDGMKKILEALGILKTTALQATADYEQGLADLSNKVKELTSDGNALAQSDLIKGGTFNLATQQGRDFFNIMKSLGEEFLASAAAGNNINEEYKKFQERLAEVSQQTGISIEDLQKLAQQVGLLPEFAKIAVQLQGKGQAEQDLANAFFNMQQMVANGVNVPVTIHPGDAGKLNETLDKILGKDMVDVDNGNLVIKPGISQDDLNRVMAKLAELGIKVGQNQIPQDKQAQMPVTPTPTALTPEQLINPNGQGTSQGPKTFEEILTGPVDDAVGGANEQGKKFDQALADGIKENGGVVSKEAKALADELKSHFHQSPPKKGPLSAHGDAAKYAGQQFAKSYSTGLSSGTGNVSRTASGIGAAASGASMSGDKNYEAGKFLGQISALVDFASNFADAMGKMTETIFGIAKFISDPMGKGTFFGQQRRWIPDPKLTGEALKVRQEDAAQNRVNSFFGSGSRPNVYDSRTGRIKGQEPGSLPDNASKQDRANYIIDKALSLGYSREQANEFLIQAVGESGLDPNASNPSGWDGIFQFDAPTWKGAGGGDIKNAQQNIDNYFKLAAQRGLTPENFTAGSQLGTQVSIGGPWHPENAAKGHLTQAQAAAQEYIKNYQARGGQFVDGVAPGIPVSPGNLKPSTKLVDQNGRQSGILAQRGAAILEQMFPGIASIGGARDDALPMHPAGRALDIGIGEVNPTNQALGDRINTWVRENAKDLGVDSTIWRDTWMDFKGNKSNVPGHQNHVHIQFADGATANIDPDGTMNLKVPSDSPLAGANYGLPARPEDDPKSAPKTLVTRNPDGTFSAVHGDGADQKPGPDAINWATGQPWTPEEAAAFWNRPENALRYDQSQVRTGDLDMAGVFQGTEKDQLNLLKQNNPLLAKAITVAENKDGTSSQSDVMTALDILTAAQQGQLDLKTPGGRQAASTIGGIISSAASEQGLVQEENPIDQASAIAGTATSIASDIFQVINSAIDSIGATKNITQTLARGVSNSEQIFSMIDDFQKYIQVAADVAGAVSSITGAVGSIVGAGAGGDPSGATSGAAAAIQGVSQIAGLVQSSLETVNAFIDLGQELYRIVGSYAGDFLSQLFGGADGALMGNIKFLLDEKTNELLAYSADNPLDKRSHPLAGGTNPDARGQTIGTLNMYGGPGTDPRDMTRQMMLQVRTTQLTGATNQ